MKVNIWSDIRCPFCYIAKKNFENALEQFSYKEELDIVWKSYELDPDLKTDENLQTIEYLASMKRMSIEEVEQIMKQAKIMGAKVGVEMNIEKAIPANTRNAHRLIHLAISKNKEKTNQLVEELFKAHFTDGLNVDDDKTLLSIADKAGLKIQGVQKVLQSNEYAYEVKQDQAEASNRGIRGVPYFIFHKKIAVSGAQSVETFLSALEKSWHYYKEDQKPIKIISAYTCDTNGNCD